MTEVEVGRYGWVVPAECRVGKEGATDPRREGTFFELGRDPWEGATQLGVWVGVSRFLKFPILENFAEIRKSRLRPSGRIFSRLAVGGYTRRGDGEQWERASSETARSFLPPAPSWRVWVRTHRAYPFWKVLPSGGAFHKPSAGGLLWPVA